MWFASIWVVTLGHSWQSGANFFKNNLLDYCPASNTLGWRWVAGLQTVGKPYIARADNIKFFTNGRFYPQHKFKEDFILKSQNITNSKSKDSVKSNAKQIKKYENLGIIINNTDPVSYTPLTLPPPPNVYFSFDSFSLQKQPTQNANT